MSDLVNVVKALLGSKFDVRSFEAKNRVFEFDHQQMNMFEFVRCSKNDVQVRSMFDKMVFDPSLTDVDSFPTRFLIGQYVNDLISRKYPSKSKLLSLLCVITNVTSQQY